MPGQVMRSPPAATRAISPPCAARPCFVGADLAAQPRSRRSSAMLPGVPGQAPVAAWGGAQVPSSVPSSMPRFGQPQGTALAGVPAAGPCLGQTGPGGGVHFPFTASPRLSSRRLSVPQPMASPMLLGRATMAASPFVFQAVGPSAQEGEPGACKLSGAQPSAVWHDDAQAHDNVWTDPFVREI